MASSDLEARFKKAVWLVRNGPPITDDRATNDAKLTFYKYFKQVWNLRWVGLQPAVGARAPRRRAGGRSEQAGRSTD